MKVIVCEPQKKARVVDIDDSLETLQETVGGYIETVYPFYDDGVLLICNEEGKLDGSLPNRRIPEISDIIFGTFLVVGDGEDVFRSLTDEEIERYLARFEPAEYWYASLEDYLKDNA